MCRILGIHPVGAEFRLQVFDVLLGLDTGVPQRVELGLVAPLAPFGTVVGLVGFLPLRVLLRLALGEDQGRVLHGVFGVRRGWCHRV